MYFPRAASASSASSAAGPPTSPALAPGGWAAPTTAPASVTVHYHYLAGRYRDLSSEHGLGLARLSSVPEAGAGSASGSDAGSVKAASLRSDAASLRPRVNLGGIFLGAKRPHGPHPGALDVPGSAAHEQTQPPRRKSKREHARERVRQDEVLRRRIEGARDVGRLKWEAKSALHSASHSLALLLLTRAATLHSLSSALQLASLYATGAARGGAPLVVLLPRDPLLALAWAFEAAALFTQRLDSRSRRAEPPRADDGRTRAQLAALLSTLLRTPQADPVREHGAQVMLPAALPPSSSSSSKKPTELWSELPNVLGGLSGLPTTPLETAGPDDEEDLARAAATARDLALVRAIALTRATLAPGEGGWAQAVRREWDEVRESMGGEQFAPILAAAEALCEQLERKKRKEADVRAASQNLARALVESLPEARIPVSETRARPVPPSSPPRKSASTTAPTGRARRRSLELSSARAPMLLFPRGAGSAPAQAASTVALADPASKPDSPRRALGRTISLQNGLATKAPSSAMLEVKPSSGLRARRPSSVCSDSPSLLFPPHDEEEDVEQTHLRPPPPVNGHNGGGMSQASSSNSLWSAAGGSIRQPSGGAPRRVASLYGMPSAGPSTVSTSGANVADYGDVGGTFDPTATLRAAQSRRNRVMSSGASISTVMSVLSTAPSIAESMAWERNQPLRDDGVPCAADTLRRLRIASSSSRSNLHALLAHGDGPAAPQLAERLERTIGASPARSMRHASLGVRRRTGSNASMTSLSSFVSTASRQAASGARAPLAPALGRPLTSQYEVRPAMSRATSVGSGGDALGSLRRFGAPNGTNGSSKRSPLPPSLRLDSSAAPSESSSPRGSEPPTRSASGTATPRSFAGVDPTLSRPPPPARAESSTSLTPLSPTPMSPSASSSASHGGGGGDELDAALASAEEHSRLKTAARCDGCGRSVVNAPVSRSGQVWCGRECRMAAKEKGKQRAA